MRPRLPRTGLVATFLIAWLAVSSSAAEPLKSVSALAKRLQTRGRGEATLTQTVIAQGETLRTERGRLALEPPDRLRIDYRSNGERVTMRADGGEWIQPSLRQLLILRPEQAQAVVATWRAFLDGGDKAYRERAVGTRRYRLTPIVASEQGTDSLEVELGSDALPRRIDLWVGEQRWRLALTGWTFRRAKGASGFTLRAPAGYSVFEWP